MLKKISYVVLVTFCLLITGCINNFKSINNIEDLSNSKIGVYTGSEYDTILKNNIKSATPAYYNSYSDEISALKSGKIDAFLTDEPLAKEILKNNYGLKILNEKLTIDSYAFAINPQKNTLKEEIDEIILEMKKDGTLTELEEKWFGDKEELKVLEKYNYKYTDIIKFATVSGSAPFAYMKNNKIVGYDIDIINYIGYKLGYKIEIVEMAFEGMIAALVSGKVDMAGCSIIVTEERQKVVLFSEPNYTGGIVLVTRQ
ncbi:MAG: transporter substrate-binding domain-containing protein [Firmicutes bacterium]|nr:transporter substrate-binding domain-containing protein [Bacillota bacterium]